MSSKLIELPSVYATLESDLSKNKPMYMDYIYDTIESKYKNNKLPNKIPLFKFKNTNLVIVITNDHMSVVLQNLLDYYIEIELYEKCNLLKEIINNID
tara:strand:- start:640 stop:933 length:294 start_codon:yes stop_codon:yes gene_type:complete